MKKLSKKTKSKKSRKVTYLWVLVALFILVTVYMTIQTASAGAQLAHLEDRRVALIEENERLTRIVMQSTSLTKTEEKSEDLGFAKPQQTVFMKAHEAVADSAGF